MNNSSALKKQKRRSLMKRQEQKTAYLCLIPAFLGLTFITYIPLILVFVLSLCNYNGFIDPKFIGFENYINLFTKDSSFIDSIWATVKYTLFSVGGSMIYSLFIAMLLNRKVPARAFWRAIFYLPYIVPAMVTSIVWNWLFNVDMGVLNYLLKILHLPTSKFIMSKDSVVQSMALMGIWACGNLVVIYLAGLQNVPRVYHEAAELDGANGWQRFWHITVPCMTPIIFYNLMMSLVANMQVFVPSMALTQGGPANASLFMVYYMYKKAFTQNQMGYACAVSFVFFLLIAIFTVVIFSTSNSWIYYEGEDN